MCCGNKREALLNNISYNNPAPVISEFPGKVISTNDVSFEYIGEKSLTVIGSLSRKQYFFSKKGDVLSVNGKDAPGMMGVPNLKKVRS